MSGMFIVVEGPNGVGKTTAATLLATRLRERNERPVHLTTEPSNTPLGRLLRSSEAVLNGRALALAIAADRYAHLDSEVVPLLDDGHTRGLRPLRAVVPGAATGRWARPVARSGATTPTCCRPR